MPSIRKRAMNYLDRLNLRALKDQCRKLVARASFPSHSRPSISRPPIIIGSPTNFRRDTDPFSSMIALPANRDYAEREGIVAPNSSFKSQELPMGSTPEPRSASSHSASTQAESSRTTTNPAQAVSTSEEQTPAGNAGPDPLLTLEYVRPLRSRVKVDMA